jgi:DNA gyrase subunit A
VVGRTAQGVKGIDLGEDDEAVGMLLIRREAAVLTVTEDGTGKRTPVSDFPLQRRGGMGTLAVPSGGKGSRVVAALEVLPQEDVMVILAGGQVTRVHAADVPLQGRRTQGKRLVKVKGGDRVAQVTRAAGDEAPGRSSGNGAAPGEYVDDAEDGGEAEVGQLDLLG